MRFFAPATVAVLGWGALAFGAEFSWAYAPLLVLCATVGLLGQLGPSASISPSRSLALALATIFGAGVLQVVPAPERVITTLSPARFAADYRQLYATAVPQPPEDPDAPGSSARTLSIRPSRTVLGLAFLGGFALFFFGCTRALSIVGPVGIARGVLVLGLLVALVGIIQSASSSGLVYGFWYPRKNMQQPFAPFINTNHFAGWMVMALSLSVGYLCGGVARGMRHVEPDWRNRILWASSREASEMVLAGFTITFMALSLVLSLSRSGMTCLVLALTVSGWWAVRRQSAGARRILVPTGLAFVLIVAVGWGGVDAVGQEFSTAWSDVGGRLGIWQDTIGIIQDFPLAGTGLNTYGIAMLGYQTFWPDRHWVEAHNDYLQLAAEGGLLLGLPIVITIFLFVREVRRRFRESADDTQTYWLRAGAVTGLIAIAFQEVVDFSLQMPGNAALFAVLAAIAVHRPYKRVRVRPSRVITSIP